VPVVQISTDYVFDGRKRSAYTEDDRVNPVSVYGRSKAAAESALTASGCAFWNFRTSWIYSARGKNFLLTMLKALRERAEVRVVGDQLGAPTWARVVAQGVVSAISPALAGRVQLGELFGGRSGHYHLVCAGATTWYGFATAIAEILGQRTDGTLARVLPISTAEYPTRAQRPSNSQLAGERMQDHFGFVGPDWRRALELCIDDLLSPAEE